MRGQPVVALSANAIQTAKLVPCCATGPHLLAIIYRPITTPIQQASINLAMKKLAEVLSVFVAGPYISKEWTEEERSQQPLAAQLRLSIRECIEDQLGHKVVFGEHRGLNEMGVEHFGGHSSAAIAELVLAQESHAIVIIPSSVGSFCELGYWAGMEDLCRKMLIIAESKYQSHESYINLGTYKMAEIHGAKINWCDFDQPDKIIDSIKTFIKSAHERALYRKVNRGS